MKKLILKENQLKYIKQFIFEAEKNENLDIFIKNIISEFNVSMSSIKPGAGIIFGSGEVNVDNDSFNMDNLNYYAFLVTEVEKGKINLNFMKSDFNGPFKAYDQYFIDPNHTLVFNNGRPFVNVFSGGGKNPITPHKIPHFVMFQVYPDIITIRDRSDSKFIDDLIKKTTNLANKDKKERLKKELDNKFGKEAEKFKEEALKQWEEGSKNIMKSMIFEPGMLGMDNFFFYPTGIIPMNDILKKYGLAVHADDGNRSGYSNDSNGLKFQLLGDDILDTEGETALGKNKASEGYSGKFDVDSNEIRYEHDDIQLLFKLMGNHELNPGVVIDGTVTGFNKDSEVPQKKVKIKII